MGTELDPHEGRLIPLRPVPPRYATRAGGSRRPTERPGMYRTVWDALHSLVVALICGWCGVAGLVLLPAFTLLWLSGFLHITF